MIWAGIGSRETPADILKEMFWIGEALCEDGSTLRTGGAPGADQACEGGYAACMSKGETFIQEHAEIYLPWASFESGNRSWIEPKLTEAADWAYEIAAEYHPSWIYLKQGAKRLHARNVHQILGATQDGPVTDTVICWTKGARGGGGTGQALRIAKGYDVPIFDLADPEQRKEILEELGIHPWRPPNG